MPKTPESGGIPLPFSWPPFTRDIWDDRAESLLESLGRMGHELEGYIVVPAVHSVGDYVPPKQQKEQVESSSVVSETANSAAHSGGGGEDGKPKKPAVKPTKALITYEQRRKFITKSMDLHRHTVGGGRSGRRGRAEVVAFLRYTLEKLDEKQQEAMEEGDELDTEQMERDGKGRFVGKKDDDSSSSSEEEEEEEPEEEEAEEEEEAAEEDEDYDEPPRKRRPGRPARKTTKLPEASTSSTTVKKGKPNLKIMSEEEFLEQHNDLCEVCNTPGELLCCATCNLVFHVECARPKIASMEEAPDDWKCAYCWAAGVMGGKKDGKDRRKAAQAIREMERAKRELKGNKGKGGRPLSKKTIDKEVEAAVEAAINSVDGKATLAEAAAAGCRKCKKELDTGEKTRKTHDDHCPRKWRSVGKPPGTEVIDIAVPVKEESKPKPMRSAWRARSLSPPKSNRSLSPPKQRGRSRTPEPDATQPTSTQSRGRPRRPRSQPPPKTESSDEAAVSGANRPPLEVGAAAGCVKCQRELENGEKTRKTHDDHCPRKFKGVGRTARWQQAPRTSPAASRQVLKQEPMQEDMAEKVNVNVPKKEKAPRVCQMEGCNKLKQYNCEGYCMRHYRQVVLEGDQDETEEEVEEEEDVNEEEEEDVNAEEEEEEEEEVIERPSKTCRLDGCSKLKQYNCDGYCMRHYRQYVLEGQQKEEDEEKEEDADEEEDEEKEEDADEEEDEVIEEEGKVKEEASEKDEEKEEVTKEVEEKEEATEVDEGGEEEVTEDGSVKDEKIEEEEEEEKEGTIVDEVKEEKTRVCRYDECNKYKQYNCDGYCMRHYRQVVLEGEGEEKRGTETVGDVAKDEATPDGAKSTSPLPTSESSPVKVEKEEEGKAEKEVDVSEKKSAQRASPAPPTLEEAAAAGCKKCRLEFETGEKTRKTHNDNCPRKWKSAGKPPPGIPAPTAGKKKKRFQSPVRSSQSMEDDESAVAALVAVAAATANTRRSSRSADTPKAEESSTRIRRERKKPTVYSPQEGIPDREWQPDGPSTSPQKKGGKKTEKKDEVPLPPKPKRGRPSRAEIAAREAYAAYVAKSKSPPPKERKKPGPKPKKEKEKEKKSPPKKAAPLKKGPVIKPDTEGVGVLNRLPGALFDCSACLDINKIKLCCYCACRVCFNKFGKERTILCDKCDQEYHTFCVGLDKIPEGEWVCTACIDDEKKQKILAQRRKEREARKKIEDEKRALDDAKKAVLAAERKKKNNERKAIENEKKRVASEQRRIAAEKRKMRDAELRARGIPVKRGPGRPRKDEQRLLEALAQQPQKRGRGRPRKDGKDPIPRKFMSKYEISADNVYFEDESELTAAHRSRSGRKIQRTIFHDEVDHPGLMKKARTDEYVGYEKGVSSSGKGKTASGKKEGRRKPGARECMQLTKKFDATPIDEQSFDVLMDYSKRGKVDHLIRMRERLDDHSRFLEAELAGLEALAKEKGELNIVCPPKSD